jgi:hypothetical protein
MPLVQITVARPLLARLAKQGSVIDLPALHTWLCTEERFNVATEKATTPLHISLREAATAMYPQTDLLVDIRCKNKPERTNDRLHRIGRDLLRYLRESEGFPADFDGRVRIEKYAVDLEASEITIPGAR